MATFDLSTCLPADWQSDTWSIRDANSGEIDAIGQWTGGADDPSIVFTVPALLSFYYLSDETSGAQWGPFDASNTNPIASCRTLGDESMPRIEIYVDASSCTASHWSTDAWTMRRPANQGQGAVLSNSIVYTNLHGIINFAAVNGSPYVVRDDTTGEYWGPFAAGTSPTLSC